MGDGVSAPVIVLDRESHLVGAGRLEGVAGIPLRRTGPIAETPGPAHDGPVAVLTAVGERAGQLAAGTPEIRAGSDIAAGRNHGNALGRGRLGATVIGDGQRHGRGPRSRVGAVRAGGAGGTPVSEGPAPGQDNP